MQEAMSVYRRLRGCARGCGVCRRLLGVQEAVGCAGGYECVQDAVGCAGGCEVCRRLWLSVSGFSFFCFLHIKLPLCTHYSLTILKVLSILTKKITQTTNYCSMLGWKVGALGLVSSYN